jgi:hypothetical protein
MLYVEFNFRVSNPEDSGSSIVYKAKGVESKARVKVNAATLTS